jgi:N-methylhydantoinase B
MAEIVTPYVIWEWSAVMDSAGAGRHRGGFAAVVSMEALIDGFVMPMVDGARSSAPGAQGGGPGPTCFAVVHDRSPGSPVPSWNGIMAASAFTPVFGIFDDEGRPDPEAGRFANGTLESTCHLVAFPVRAGQVYRQVSAGAGGFGDPLERDPLAVLRDVSNELVSRRQARETYGVIVDADARDVDVHATRILREELQAQRDAGAWSVPRSFHRDWPVDQSDLDDVAGRPLAGAAPQEA